MVRRIRFADPGGVSALRAGKRIHPCPDCGRKNQLTDEDIRLHYHCDFCAEELEGPNFQAREDFEPEEEYEDDYEDDLEDDWEEE